MQFLTFKISTWWNIWSVLCFSTAQDSHKLIEIEGPQSRQRQVAAQAQKKRDSKNDPSISRVVSSAVSRTFDQASSALRSLCKWTVSPSSSPSLPICKSEQKEPSPWSSAVAGWSWVSPTTTLVPPQVPQESPTASQHIGNVVLVLLHLLYDTLHWLEPWFPLSSVEVEQHKEWTSKEIPASTSPNK